MFVCSATHKTKVGSLSVCMCSVCVCVQVGGCVGGFQDSCPLLSLSLLSLPPSLSLSLSLSLSPSLTPAHVLLPGANGAGRHL